jgi:hypothetical protein
MFDSEEWFKETLVLIGLITVVWVVVSMLVPFPLSYPVAVVAIILIVWRIHKRSRHVPHSSKI